jgi:methylated-DNA-[protein]-cysteine S-methyltransferase
MPQLSLHSQIGDVTISEDAGTIVAIDWGWGRDQTPTPLLKRAIKQLNDYFDGALDEFSLPLQPHGSSFQRRVWKHMLRIPYGKTKTYGEIATAIGASARAVGGACGRNPIPIIIPCHRVTSASGLGGYSGAGGRETKLALLALEGAAAVTQLSLGFARG